MGRPSGIPEVVCDAADDRGERLIAHETVAGQHKSCACRPQGALPEAHPSGAVKDEVGDDDVRPRPVLIGFLGLERPLDGAIGLQVKGGTRDGTGALL